MSRSFILNTFRFVLVLIIQVTICSNINLFGHINPFVYIIYILLFPTNYNRLTFLLSSFFLGLVLDIFLDSGGVHAAASVFLAYIRPVFLKYAYGTIYETATFKFEKAELKNLFGYVLLSSLFHHIIVFGLEIFSSSQILLIIKSAVLACIFTAFLSFLLILLFRTRKWENYYLSL